MKTKTSAAAALALGLATATAAPAAADNNIDHRYFQLCTPADSTQLMLRVETHFNPRAGAKQRGEFMDKLQDELQKPMGSLLEVMHEELEKKGKITDTKIALFYPLMRNDLVRMSNMLNRNRTVVKVSFGDAVLATGCGFETDVMAQYRRAHTEFFSSLNERKYYSPHWPGQALAKPFSITTP